MKAGGFAAEFVGQESVGLDETLLLIGGEKSPPGFFKQILGDGGEHNIRIQEYRNRGNRE